MPTERTFPIAHCILFSQVQAQEKNLVKDGVLYTTIVFPDQTAISLVNNKPTHKCPSHITGSCGEMPINEFAVGYDRPQTDVALSCEHNTCPYFKTQETR